MPDKINYCDHLGFCTCHAEEKCGFYVKSERFPFPGACIMCGMSGTCMSPQANAAADQAAEKQAIA